MTKQEYKDKHYELTQRLAKVNDELSKLHYDYLNYIRDEAEKIGLKYGAEVIVHGAHVYPFDGRDITCTFNGAYINRQNYFYLEFTYPMPLEEIRFGMTREYVEAHPHIIDPNDDFSFEVGGKIYDYHEFMRQFQ